MSGWGNAGRGRASPATASPTTGERERPAWATRHLNSPGAPPTTSPGTATAPAARGGWGKSASPATGSPATGSPATAPRAPATSGWSSRGGSAPQARRAADNAAVPAWAARNMDQSELKPEDEDTAGDDWAEQLKKAAEEFLEEHRVQTEDPEETVMRMLAMAAETMEIADNTNSELDRQIGALKTQQQDMAEIHDMLNRSDKDMNAIKSFWGGWKNIGNKKKDDQHQKLQAKWEQEFADEMEREKKVAGKQWRAQEKESWKQNKQAINETVQSEKKNVHAAKKESQALAKDIKKGRADGPQGERQQMAGGFVWEQRTDGVGQKCAAEAGLDQLEDYTSGFVDRALAASAAIRETQIRLDRVNEDMDRANSRIEVLNDRGRRYAK